MINEWIAELRIQRWYDFSPINIPQKIKPAKPENKSSTEEINKSAEIKPSAQTEEVKIMVILT